jgi:hypothetical protein
MNFKLERHEKEEATTNVKMDLTEMWCRLNQLRNNRFLNTDLQKTIIS